MDNREDIYYEYLSLLKKYLYHKTQYHLYKKFPFLFDNNRDINEQAYLNAKTDYENFETAHKIILDRFYLSCIKRRLSTFDFELLLLLFFNIEDLKFNALIKKIKDPDKIPLSEEDYYEINLNEALELIVLDEKEKFITRKHFLLYSYLLEHRIITFIFSENVSDNPLIYNENLKLNTHIFNKIMDMDTHQKEVKHSLPYYNRLRIGEDGF